MPNVSYGRCPNSDPGDRVAQIGINPDTGQPVELDINGVASVTAVQSALLTLGAALKKGHEKDFLEKVALCLFGKLVDDPHALCPLLTICSMCLLMLTKQAGVTFDEEGRVVIVPPDSSAEAGPTGPTCMFDDDDGEDEDYGTNEESMDDLGPDSTGGDMPNPD